MSQHTRAAAASCAAIGECPNRLGEWGPTAHLTIFVAAAINYAMLRGEVRVYRYSYRYATHGPQAVACV